jgi:hypothetical protein
VLGEEAAEGAAEAEGLTDSEAEGEMAPTPGFVPDGFPPLLTISTMMPRNRRTAITAAAGRKDWAPDPARRAMTCLSVGFLAGV